MAILGTKLFAFEFRELLDWNVVASAAIKASVALLMLFVGRCFKLCVSIAR